MIAPYTMTLTDMYIEEIVVNVKPTTQLRKLYIYSTSLNDNKFSSTVFLDVCSSTSIISVLVHYIF